VSRFGRRRAGSARSRARAFIAIALAVGWPAAVGASAAEGADPAAHGLAMFEEVDRRDSGFGDLQVDLRMILRTANGDSSERELRIRQLEVDGDGDKMLVIFDTPKAISGTALLSFSHKVEQDDQWLYLPAMQRVKKIASRNKSGPFLSSEFAFEDLTSQEVEKYDYQWLRRETFEGAPCFVVARVPRDEYSGYSRQIVWVDEAEYRLQRIEYYDRRGALMKTLAFGGYERHEGRFWRAATMRMENQQTGKSTELEWRNFRFGTGLDESRDFTTNSLRRVR
jgi:outer membrane lipoprotein-sorting protein